MRISCLQTLGARVSTLAPARLPEAQSPRRRHQRRNHADLRGPWWAQGGATGQERTARTVRVTHIRLPAPAGNLPHSGLRPGSCGGSPSQRQAHLRQRGRTLWAMAAEPALPAAPCLQSRPRQRLHPAPDCPLRGPSGAAGGRRGRRGIARPGMPRTAVVHCHGDLGNPVARGAA